MQFKISLTHPLRIYAISPDNISGDMDMTLCPGKHQSNALTGCWFRDLGTDLNVIKNWETKIHNSLNETREFGKYCVNHIPERVKNFDIEWVHLLYGIGGYLIVSFSYPVTANCT